MMLRTLLAAAVVATAVVANAASALAQPLPPNHHENDPIDPDWEREQRSSLWDSAVAPGAKDEQKALAVARRLLLLNEWQTLTSTVTPALKDNPNHAELRRLRAIANYFSGNWSECATDYAFVLTHKDMRNRTLEAMVSNQLSKGLIDEVAYATCLAKGGDVRKAEQILASITSREVRNQSYEQRELQSAFLRHGEVLLASGRIGDAIAVFEQGLVDHNLETNRRLHWLLATAYTWLDRPSKANEFLEKERFVEPREASSPTFPSIVPALDYYVRALAYATIAKRKSRRGAGTGDISFPAEVAIVNARRFLAEKPTIGKRQASELLTAAGAMLDSSVYLHNVIELKPGVINAEVKSKFPELRKCAASTPHTIWRLTYQRTGDLTALATAQHRSRPAAPQPTVPTVEYIGGEEPSDAQTEQVRSCATQEKLALRLAPPTDPVTMRVIVGLVY